MHARLITGVAVLALAGGGTSAALAAKTAAAPKNVTVKQLGGSEFKANRYVKDKLRFDKDVYTVKTGGTVSFKWTNADEGPHTLTVLKKKDLPTSFRCPVCDKLTKAHGADPNSQAPPKFDFLENGKGSKTPPNLDRAGDSALTGAKPGSVVKLKVTAKAGTTLHFVCLIHTWMQAQIKVVK